MIKTKTIPRTTAAVFATATLAVGVAIGVATPASASPPIPPTVSATASGSTIDMTVTNPNVADPDTFDTSPICVPVVLEYRLVEQPFSWTPEPPETTPETARADLIAAGLAPPGASASSSVTVPRDALYMVGAICQGIEGQSIIPVPKTVIVGSGAPTGPVVTATAAGRVITAKVTNSTSDAGCGIGIQELTLAPNPYVFRSAEAVGPGETTTEVVTVPRDGNYAVAGLCEGAEYAEFTNPPKVLEVPGGVAPNQPCFGSVCLPLGFGL